jgi:hypothetical protein
MTDWTNFKPANVDELVKAFTEEGRAAIGGAIDNSQAVAGHLRTLAEASVKTMGALALGQIDAQTAKTIMDERKDVIKQAFQFEAYMALVVAQKLTDAIFRVLGWAIFNRTGINIAPGLVDPHQGAGGTS